MTFSQMMLMIAAVGLMMISFDYILGKFYKDWKTMPWEEVEDETGSDAGATGTR